ncbi:MAG: hypothetical protein AAFZ87_13100, partial [Planctomycetota bacterium]
ATPELVSALRSTASRLREGSSFSWGHMGACICGHLAQTVCELPAAEIHRRALERHGDWSQQSVDHCPSSGLAIDHVIDEMLALGLSLSDIRHLEHLSDPKVLRRVPAKWLRRQDREHAVQYMEAFAELLEQGLEADGVAAELPAAEPTAPEAAALEIDVEAESADDVEVQESAWAARD